MLQVIEHQMSRHAREKIHDAICISQIPTIARAQVRLAQHCLFQYATTLRMQSGRLNRQENPFR
jgi:hypothetical protein